MIWLLVAVIIIALILLMPVTLKVGFDGNFVYGVYVWFFKIPIGKKTKKQKDAKSVPVEKNKFKTGFSDVTKIIPKLVKHALKSMTVTKLRVDILIATDDPCDTAIIFGYTNSGVYTALGIAENYLKIKNPEINISADYNADTITVGFEAAVSTNVARLLVCLFRLISDGLLKTLI